MKMKAFLVHTGKILLNLIFFGLVPYFALAQAKTEDKIILSSSGWTLDARPTTGELSITHESLGIVLKEIRINIKSRQGLTLVKDWIAEKKSENQLFIQTPQKGAVLVIELNRNKILISATRTDLVLTAIAPASSDRIVSRLLDRRGVPVNWMGTEETKQSWNGQETINSSNLPFNNPEVMTFSLGQVSAENLHSLFDRKRDIAISFSDKTIMQRNPEDPDLLDITIPVPGNTMVTLIPDYYTKTLGLPYYSRFDDSVFPTAPIIWGSWTAYYHQAKESDIISNADWIASNLKSYGFRYVQIDDGYDRGNVESHHWIENWNKSLFPHGPEWIARYIKEKGLSPGLWIVPNAYEGFYEKYPDRYIYYKSGEVIKDYRTPALDYTNPAVQEWLKELFSTLKGWGFEYFKFDGEVPIPAYAPEIDRSRLYNKDIDPIVAYRNRLNLIRDVIGPETFVEVCAAGAPLNSVGFFNSVFNGSDMYNSWNGCYSVLSSINSNTFFNHIVGYSMPGEGIDVSPVKSVEEAKKTMPPRAMEVLQSRDYLSSGFGTTLPEARTLVTFISLTGVAYPLSSIMPTLPEERVRLLKMTMPTMPVLPVDLFSRGTITKWDQFKSNTTNDYIHNFPEILDLKINSRAGVYDVVALTNWRSGTATKEISFSDKLGLNAAIPYVIFDFWNQKLLGVFKDTLQIHIEEHDTRVLQVHPLQQNPQLIGTSRHISGSFSIIDLAWNNMKKVLRGTSETVQGDTYSLFIYIPDGFSISNAKATTGENHELQVKSEFAGNLLKLSFQGQSKSIEWQVQFN
jgi:hypothetical protein